ncbi:MAG: virulence factor TspB C-terminal domain-related protein, partial [Methylococcales bacterium]|nr:virulence factor TspB C-terminal domain-related protein [Methylococcales bacterium]
LLAHCWENCPWTVDANADSHDPAWSPTTTTSSASDADWSDAISKLSSAANSLQKLSDMVQGLLGKGQAIPIDNPVLSPSSITTAPVSTVIRDSAGNVIKTVTESVTYNSSPINIYDNSYNPITNITSIVNSTFTDNTTNITTTTTTTNDSPPVDSPPDDPSVEFDTVDDVDLPTQSLPDMATPVSWGEGTCPADPVATVFGHPIPIPVHVVCTYMSGVRTAVILLFSLIAAYIVIGVKFEG